MNRTRIEDATSDNRTRADEPGERRETNSSVMAPFSEFRQFRLEILEGSE